MSITFNPYLTSVADGSFNAQSTGFIQGQALDNPSSRNYLAGGVLAQSETVPMWGGIPIVEYVPSPGGSGLDNPLGGNIVRAVAAGVATITGFTVFDQNYSAINSPQSQVPLVGVGGLVNFYRLGSKARIAVQCDPALISLEGGAINATVGWDFVTNLGRLSASNPGLPVKVLEIVNGNCMMVTWDSVNLRATWNRNGCVAIIEI